MIILKNEKSFEKNLKKLNSLKNVRVEIAFSKSGITQYNSFFISEDGFIYSDKNRISVSYQKDKPILPPKSKLIDLLKILKDYSFDKEVTIFKINDDIPSFYFKKLDFSIYNKELQKVFREFFIKEIAPKLKKYDIRLGFVEKDNLLLKEVNYNLYVKLNYICYKFLYNLYLVKNDDFKYIHTDYISKIIDLAGLFKLGPIRDLDKTNF
jgi:hypothetical protein